MYFFHPKWPVFHLDNHLLVLYKPAGLIMQRDKPGKANLQDLAKVWLKRQYAKPGQVFAGLVHRLDAPVAGVIVLARTSKAAARLSTQFRQNAVDKTYLAVIRGRPPRQTDRLVHNLERVGRLSKVVSKASSASREARLTYHVLASDGACALLEIALETGRHHQIRVQLAAVGCPIVGDVSYGAGETLADGRIALMARRISFEHPTRKEIMQFETPPPINWPLSPGRLEQYAPLWSLEDFQRDGLRLSILDAESGAALSGK